MAKSKIGVDFIIDDKGNIRKLGDAAEKTGRKVGKLGENSRTADRNIKGVASASANATKNFSKMGQGMGGLVGLYATFAANVFALTAVFGFLKDIGDLAALERGQAAYALNTGTNMKFLANSIKEATGSIISFREASQAAAIGTAAGLTQTQLKEIATLAKNASITLGRDLTDSFNRLTRGIIKAEPELLDELGIIIRLDRVMKEYAASIGVTVTELTQFERSQAVANAVLTQGGDKFQDMGDNVNETSKALEALNELLDEVKRKLAPVTESVAKGLTDALKSAEASTVSFGDVVGALFGGGVLATMFGNFFSSASEKVGQGGKKISEKLKDLFTNSGRSLLGGAKRLVLSGLATIFRTFTARVTAGVLIMDAVLGTKMIEKLTAIFKMTDEEKQKQNIFAEQNDNVDALVANMETYHEMGLKPVNRTLQDMLVRYKALAETDFKNVEDLAKDFRAGKVLSSVEEQDDFGRTGRTITTYGFAGGSEDIDHNNDLLKLMNIELSIARNTISQMTLLKDKIGMETGAARDLERATITLGQMDELMERINTNKDFTDIAGMNKFNSAFREFGLTVGMLRQDMENLQDSTIVATQKVSQGLIEQAEAFDKIMQAQGGAASVFDKTQTLISTNIRLLKDAEAIAGGDGLSKGRAAFGLSESEFASTAKILGDLQVESMSGAKILEALANRSLEIKSREEAININVLKAQEAQVIALGKAMTFEKARVQAQSSYDIAKAKELKLVAQIAQEEDAQFALSGTRTNSKIEQMKIQLNLSEAQVAEALKLLTIENKESVKLARKNIDQINFDQKRLSILESIESVERRIAKIKINDLNRSIAEEERKRANDIQAVELSGKGDVQKRFALEKINREADIAVLEKRKSIIEEEKLAKLDALTREEEMLTLKYDLQINELELLKETRDIETTRIAAIEQLITRLQDAKKGLSGDDGTIEGLKGDVKDDAESKTKDIDSQIERSRKAQREIMDINQLSQSATNSLADGMGQALGDLMTGTSSFKDAFKNMAKSVLADITRMIAKQLVLRALFGPSGQGGIMSIFSKKDGGIIHAANGGIFKTARNYEYGGVARGPTRGHPAILHGTEAVVPLPNNREIPVEMKGMPAQSGDTTNVSINVNSDGSMSTSGDPGQGEALGQLLARAVQQELQNQKRSGGILSPNGVA
tara:strand:- start:8899 stop:12414 length:3516 start_codon:yes stop_codon:yes gene_type:complete